MTPPYLSLDETWRHIAYVSEKGIKHLRTSEIRVGDQFEINNPGDPLHGERFKCTGIKENARTSKEAPPIPCLVEFRVSQRKYPNLFDPTTESEPRKKALMETGLWVQTWAEDSQKCQHVPASDEAVDAIKGLAFAITEILTTGLAGAINVEGRPCAKGGRKLIRSKLEFIPAATFDKARIDADGGHGKLYPAYPNAPDAIIYKDLRFPHDKVLELWPAPQAVVETESIEEKTAEEPGETQAMHDGRAQDTTDKGKMARPPGRPSLRPEIEAAYRALVREKKVDFKSKKANYGPIRKRVEQDLDGPGPHKGLRDGAIRKWVGPLFDADKTA